MLDVYSNTLTFILLYFYMFIYLIFKNVITGTPRLHHYVAYFTLEI